MVRAATGPVISPDPSPGCPDRFAPQRTTPSRRNARVCPPPTTRGTLCRRMRRQTSSPIDASIASCVCGGGHHRRRAPRPSPAPTAPAATPRTSSDGPVSCCAGSLHPPTSPSESVEPAPKSALSRPSREAEDDSLTHPMPNAVTYAESSGRSTHVFVIVDANGEAGSADSKRRVPVVPTCSSAVLQLCPNATWSGDVLRDDVAMGDRHVHRALPASSAMTTLAERVRACREGARRVRELDPPSKPPPLPRRDARRATVPHALRRSGGLRDGCPLQNERRRTWRLFVRGAARGLQCHRGAPGIEEAPRNAFFSSPRDRSVCWQSSQTPLCLGSLVGVALASASAVSTIAFALLARSEILFNEMNILADRIPSPPERVPECGLPARTVCVVCPAAAFRRPSRNIAAVPDPVVTDASFQQPCYAPAGAAGRPAYPDVNVDGISLRRALQSAPDASPCARPPRAPSAP